MRFYHCHRLIRTGCVWNPTWSFNKGVGTKLSGASEGLKIERKWKSMYVSTKDQVATCAISYHHIHSFKENALVLHLLYTFRLTGLELLAGDDLVG